MKQSEIEWAKNWLAKPLGSYINGEWHVGTKDSFWLVFNPFNQEPVAQVSLATKSHLDEAVRVARDAYHSGLWQGISLRERACIMQQMGQILRDHHAELATLEVMANGKTYQEAYFDDIPDCGDVFDYYAGWINKHYGESAPVEEGFINFTRIEPIGVCAAIVPWNFPLLMACWKLAPAIAMGNAIIIKPSEYTPLSLIRLIELWDKHLVLPKGLVQCVLGGSEIGQAMSEHPGIDKIAFTGSTAVGKSIVQAAGRSNLKNVSLELGGKSPNILFDDTPDLTAAIDRSFTLMFSHKGEKCTEPTRLLVHDKLHDDVVSAIVKKANAVVCGDPFDANTHQGPQCHKKHFDKVMDYIEQGKQAGANCVVGGVQDTQGQNARGLFVRPTIFTEVSPEMSIVQEEIFGPVLVIQRFCTDDEAVALANHTSYGLAAGLWTQNISRAHRVAEQLESGMVFINRYGCYDFSSPFGGFKQSGWGKEMARQSLEAYTKTKSIWVKI